MNKPARIRILLVTQDDRLGDTVDAAIAGTYRAAQSGPAPVEKRTCNICDGTKRVIGATARACALCKQGTEHDTCRPCLACEERGWRWFDPMVKGPAAWLQADVTPGSSRALASGPKKAKKQASVPNWAPAIDKADSRGSYAELRRVMELARDRVPALYRIALVIGHAPLNERLNPSEVIALEWLARYWRGPCRIPREFVVIDGSLTETARREGVKRKHLRPLREAA